MTGSLRLRRWHAYIGLLIAPSVLFFALTGVLQLFSLHEAHGSYRPALLLEKLSAVHKDQVFEESHHHPAPNQVLEPGPTLPAATLLLKWYFCIIGAGLAVSSLIGIWMGVTQLRSKAMAWSLLIAGTLLPIATFAL